MAEREMIWHRKSEPDRWHLGGDVDGETLCGDITNDMEVGDTEWDDVILLLRCGKCVGRDEESWQAFESSEPCPDHPQSPSHASAQVRFSAAS
jgi:hypothetical protein